MADGNIHHFPARLRVVEQAPSGRHEFPAPTARYLPAETPGAVYMGIVRFEPEQVDALISFFQRKQAWALHDELVAARDGLIPNPPEAA